MEKLTNMLYDFWDKWCSYRYVDPIFSFARLCLKIGAGLTTGGIGWAVTALIPKLNIPVSIEFGPQQPIVLGTFLIISGFLLGLWRIRSGSNKIGCFLIDHRGMPGMELGDPYSILPGRLKTGQIRKIRIDYSSNKNEVLRKIETLNERLRQDLSDGISEGAGLVYAGLAPIPFLFYTGKVISSRKKCDKILEWNRHLGCWQEPSQLRQNLSFVVNEPQGQVNEDLAIAMPLSIEFGEEPVKAASNEAPIMWLHLPNGAYQDSLPSKYDQQRLATEFYDRLAGCRKLYPNLKRLHLFIAAQASFVFSIGQSYSTTVHPPISIYNFSGVDNRYDWRLNIVNEKITLEDLPTSA